MDLEAQRFAPQDCAWSTIPIPNPIPTINRGTILSRHDDPPIPSVLPCPEDAPPAYSTDYPPMPINGSDSFESATNRTAVGHNHGLRLYGTVIAVIMTVGLLGTAVSLSFFNHGKV